MDERKNKLTLFDLIQSSSEAKSVLVKILLIACCLQFCSIIAPLFFQLAIDYVIPTSNFNFLILLSICFSLVILFQMLFLFLKSNLVLYLSSSFSVQLSYRLLNQLFRLPINFFEKDEVGGILTRFESLQRIKGFISTGFIETILDLISTVTLVIVVLSYNWQISLVVFFTFAVYVFLRIISVKKYQTMIKDTITTKSAERTFFVGTVQSYKTIWTNNVAEITLEDWSELNINNANTNVKLSRFSINFKLLYDVLFGIENVTVTFLLIHSVLQQHMTLGMIIAFTSFRAILNRSSRNLIDKYIEYKGIKIHIERISTFFLPRKINELKKNLEQEVQKVTIDNMSFRHNSLAPLIEINKTISVEKGQLCLIKGPSGSGKTTLLKLLTGELEPTRGDVFYNKIKCNDLNDCFFKEKISSVWQDDTFFPGTLATNLTLTNGRYDIEKLNKILDSLAMLELIKGLKEGLKTGVSPQNKLFSKGEMQRLLLTRALYKESEILILDEVTSNLDDENESFIEEIISRDSRTKFIVTHNTMHKYKADIVIELGY